MDTHFTCLLEKKPEKKKSPSCIPFTKESVQELFNRASFDGERILLKAGEAVFGIVPVEDVLLLNAEDL